MTPPRYHYRGDLGDRPLPEVLSTIDQHGVPGIIQAIRDDVVKRIYLRDGTIVHASSSDPGDSLGAFLFRHGRIDEGAYRKARRARGNSETRFGTLLLEHGVLNETELEEAVREQVEEIVWSLFRWDAGSVTFSIGEIDVGRETLSLPTRLAIMRGALLYPRPQALLAALGPDSAVEGLWEPVDLVDLSPSNEELTVLGRVDGRRTLGELARSGGLPADDVVRLFYGLAVLQLVHIRQNLSLSVPTAGTEPPSSSLPTAVKIRVKTEGDRFSE